MGVRYRDHCGGAETELRADLTVAADGRWSTARAAAALTPRETATPFDAWWLRLPRRPEDDITSLRPNSSPGQLAVAIPREGYFQIAFFAPKGRDAEFRAAGVERFRERLGQCLPQLADRVEELKAMDDVKHLDSRLNRLRRWRTAGLLCIGDAAHAMSPVVGVGINLAVQDAVAAVTILAEPLRRGELESRHLARVRRRRWLPTFLVQRMQHLLHQAVIKRLPQASAIPAYLIGVGIRPEHAPAFAQRPPKNFRN